MSERALRCSPSTTCSRDSSSGSRSAERGSSRCDGDNGDPKWSSALGIFGIDYVAPARPCVPRLRHLLGADRFDSATLADLGLLVWPDGEFSADTGGDVDVVIGVATHGDISVGIDSHGAAIVAVDGNVDVERGDALFAALVAAALGCAQVAKRLYPEVRGGSLDEFLRFHTAPLGGPL